MVKRMFLLAMVAAVAALVVAPASLADKPVKPEKVATAEEVFGNASITTFPARKISKSEVPTTDSVDRLAVAAASACWYGTAEYSKSGWWGSWLVRQTNYWCGNGSIITSRSTGQGQSASGACYVSSDAQTWAVGGYVGSFSVDLKTQTNITCFLGWTSGSPWVVVRYYAMGAYGTLASGY